MRWSAILILFVTTVPAFGQVVARCGEGYLELEDGYRVLHLKGSPWEMGYQHGALLADEIRSLTHELLEVKAKDVSVEVFGRTLTPRPAVSLIFAFQKQWIPPRFIDEMDGVAAGAGLSKDTIYVSNSIPELFHCSGFALLDDQTTCDGLLHGRVLDYGIDWKLQDHAVLVVAEPDGGVPFANVTYAGFVGSVTGMNARQVSIGEMGGRGLGKWAGTPMAFLVRRVLEEAKTLDEAIAIFRDSRRTCEYYYVLADAKADQAVGMEAGADRFELVRPGQAHKLLPTPVPGTVLLSAGERYGHLCRLTKRVLDADGRFTPEAAIRLMDKPVAMDSNLHNVLFAPGLGKLWVANASTDMQPAWTQKSHEFDLNALLAQPLPTGSDIRTIPLPTREELAARK